MKRLCVHDFTTAEIELYIKHCNFTEDEMLVFAAKSKGMSDVQVSMNTAFSTSKITRTLNKVKQKIIKASPYVQKDLIK